VAAEVREGTYLEPTKKTFGEYVEHWRIVFLPNYKPVVRAGYESILNRHLLPEFSGWNLLAITPAAIVEFRARLLDSPDKPQFFLAATVVHVSASCLTRF
jgi:Phage integrase, N-terminal SAM-like domain